MERGKVLVAVVGLVALLTGCTQTLQRKPIWNECFFHYNSNDGLPEKVHVWRYKDGKYQGNFREINSEDAFNWYLDRACASTHYWRPKQLIAQQ